LPYKHFAHKYAEEADDADWEFAMSISKRSGPAARIEHLIKDNFN
jgi:hypothetical protein